MPRRASVRYWPSRGGYCCKLAGVQHLLASGPDDYPDSGFAYGSSSAHAGGINVCFGDGRVRFVKNGISRTVWWALGTKANGEVLSADSF